MSATKSHPIPACIKDHLPPVNDEQQSILVRCASCYAVPMFCQVDAQLKPGKAIHLECRNTLCTKRCSWWVCCSCAKKFSRRQRAEKHFEQEKHSKAVGETEPQAAALQADDYAGVVNDDSPTKREFEAQFGATAIFHPVHHPETSADASLGQLSFDNGEESSPSRESSSRLLVPSPMGTTRDCPNDLQAPEAAVISTSEFGRVPPKWSEPNLWLERLLKNTPKAELGEMYEVFGSNENLLLFWSAEHGSGEGQVGGGLKLLVGRAFLKSILVPPTSLPQFEEAQWHMKNLIQYVHNNEQSHMRQADLYADLFKFGATSIRLFKSTSIPTEGELRRIYGDGNPHSMWNTLPIPTVQKVGDIGYVSPLDICSFFFACSFPLDDIVVGPDYEAAGNSSRVFHVSDCKAVDEMKRQVVKVVQKGESAFVLVVPANDWKDGHGVNRTKNNRPSVVSWSWTLSPVKDNVNTTDNTFALAIGAKKSTYWPDVEHKFAEDLLKLGTPDKPLRLYWGLGKKMVTVYVKRIVSLADRVERTDSTYTLGHGSAIHRRFGHLIKFESPICNAKAVGQYLQARKTTTSAANIHWGWSDDPKWFESAIPNGSKLPACTHCRAWRVKGLLRGGMPGVSQEVALEEKRKACVACGDWHVGSSTRNMLSFAAGDDYPSKSASNPPSGIKPAYGRPVPPTDHRENEKGEKIPALKHLPVDFERMKMALRFAFFNATRPKKQERWNKTQTRGYLKSCGVYTAHQTELLELAEKVMKEGGQDDPKYYTDQGGIGSLRFPAPWSVEDIGPSGYIEVLMHILFLGVAKSNFELVASLLKSLREDAPFRRNANNLLIYVKRFGLSWIKAYPFSKTDMSIGAWVSENVLAWVRLSKVVYHYCERNGENSRKNGSDDIMRFVTAFAALVARLMSHSGVTKDQVEVEIDGLIKEFLSCVRELDVLARYEKMKRSSPKAAPPGAADSEPPAAETGGDNSGKKRRTPSGGAKARKPKKPRKSSSSAGGDEDEKADGGTKAWWTISNYISLLNLTEAILSFGPLVNWWDGGGKGERFIQLIKPLITRGVQERDTFFVRVVERFYKLRILSHFETMYSLYDKKATNDSEAVECYLASDGTVRPISDLQLLQDDGDGDELQDLLPIATAHDDVEYSPVEDKQMKKTKTIYIYSNKEAMENALVASEPISGILMHDPNKSSNHDGSLHLVLVYRVRRKDSTDGSRFGWVKITFDDKKGGHRGGLWYAPITKIAVRRKAPEKDADIAELAKMSAIAIPLSYANGAADDATAKSNYCVITNWWKERHSDGTYLFPGLQPSLYERHDNDQLIREQLPITLEPEEEGTNVI